MTMLGDEFSENLTILFKTLEETNPPAVAFFPYLMLTANLIQKRLRYVRVAQTGNIDATLVPPPGKRWKILNSIQVFTADANVAARSVTVNLVTEDPNSDIDDAALGLIFVEAIAATEQHYSSIGTPVSSANDNATIDKNTLQPILVTTKDSKGGLKLRLRATNRQVGDTSEIIALVEEETLFEFKL